MTGTALWEAELSKNDYGDPTYAPPQTIDVRQTKSIVTSKSSKENDYDGFYRVYLCYVPEIKAGDLIDGKRVGESRNVLDALGVYNHTKLLIRVT